MNRQWTALVLRRRLLTVLVWLTIAVLGGLTASRTADALSYEFNLPGQPGHETNVEIADRFGGGGLTDPLLIVAESDGAFDDPAAVRQFETAASGVAEAARGSRVVLPSDPGGDVLVDDAGSVAVAVVYPPITPGPEPYAQAVPALEKAAEQADVGGEPLRITGFELLSEEGGGGDDRGALAEILLGAGGALVVLVLVFGSLLAGLPLLIAAVSILGTFLCILGLTELMEVTFVVQYLAGLIGLGVAIDYSLLIVMRWREERAAGAENEEAVLIAMSTAGRAVVLSGITVAISLAALIAVPLPFLRSIGLSGLLIPLLSVATSITLLPVLLATFGPRLDWPRRTVKSPRSRAWSAIAGTVVRHRWVAAIGATVLLLLMAAPVARIALGAPQLDAYDANTPVSRAAGAVLDSSVPAGALRPTEVLVDAAGAGEAVGRLGELDGVASVAAPDRPDWANGGDRLLQVWTSEDPATDGGRAALERIRDLDLGRVGGTPSEDDDFVQAVYGSNVIWVVVAIVLATFLLLARSLRSLLLPVKALALNVLSLAAAYGLTVLIWQDGLGSELLFDTTASGVLTTWAPVAAFSFLFGLSMDYEVFLLSRMREAYDEHGDTDRAAVDGIASTGRLVTSAALILFLSFVALSTVPAIEVKILATTLALGILIDAVIVRGVLAPALVAVLGRANWTLPGPLAALVRPTYPDSADGAPRHREPVG